MPNLYGEESTATDKAQDWKEFESRLVRALGAAGIDDSQGTPGPMYLSGLWVSMREALAAVEQVADSRRLLSDPFAVMSRLDVGLYGVDVYLLPALDAARKISSRIAREAVPTRRERVGLAKAGLARFWASPQVRTEVARTIVSLCDSSWELHSLVRDAPSLWEEPTRSSVDLRRLAKVLSQVENEARKLRLLIETREQ